MARGWESKSVEMQIEAAESRAPRAEGFSAPALARMREREGFELSRVRVLHDLGQVRHQRHREMLLASLDFLEQKLKQFV